MNCEEAKHLLEGGLDFHEIIRKNHELEAHIKACPACAEEVRLLEMTVDALGEFEIEAPEAEILPAVLQSLPDIKNRISARKQLRRRMVLELAAEAVMLIGVVAAIVWAYDAGLLNALIEKGAIWIEEKYESFVSNVSSEAVSRSFMALMIASSLFALGYLLTEAAFYLTERRAVTKKPQNG